MRPQYVKLVKEYLRLKPEYRERLDELKTNALAIGVTEEEFTEAIREFQMDQQQSVKPQQIIVPQSKPISGKSKRINLDFLSKIKMPPPRVTLSVIAGFFAATVTIIYLISRYQPDTAPVQPVSNAPYISPTTSHALAPQVYASTKIINAQRVFSFPGSNITLSTAGSPTRDIYGFFPYWMLDKIDNVTLTPLTSLILFGLEIDGKGNIITQYDDGQADGGWAMWNDPRLATLIGRAKRKHIKIQLVLKAFNNSNIASIVSSDDSQKKLIANALQLINAKNLDGINIDFEYTGAIDPKLTAGFNRFIASLHNELQRQIPGSLLTVDTYASSGAGRGFFDVESLSDNSDGLIVMGYDFHTPLSDPGPISPMDGTDINILGLMQSYLEKVSPDKLILGVPYYGYDWVVSPVGKGSIENSIVSYAEIAFNSRKSPIAWDDVSQTPSYQYTDPTTNEVHEVHFENTRSLGVKYDFINKKALKGVGIWALGYDGNNAELEELLIEKFTK